MANSIIVIKKFQFFKVFLLNRGVHVQTNLAYRPEGQGSFRTKMGGFREILKSNIYGDYLGSYYDNMGRNIGKFYGIAELSEKQGEIHK
jgi:hypothetical protein